MTQTEWTDRTSHVPSESEWDAISLVYTFHPMIPDVGGKDILAHVWRDGGIGLIYDMMNTAKVAQELEDLRDKADREETAAREMKLLYMSKLSDLKARYKPA